MPLYWIGRGLFRLLLPIFGRWRVVGAENVPRNGGVIVAPNHISYADPPVVGSALRRQVRFMAKEELFRIPLLGKAIHAVGAFPVKQKSADRTAIRRAVTLLEQGELVCIFPEGTRNKSSELMEAELGIGMIALKAKVPIVPIALIGTDKLLPAHSPFLHFAKVEVRIGKPVDLTDLYEKNPDRATMEELGRRVMASIAELRS